MWQKPPLQSAGLCMWSTVALWNSERTIPGRPLSAWWWSQCPRPQPTSEQDVVAAAARESVIAFIQVCVAFLKGFRLSQSACTLESVPIISPHKIQTSFTRSSVTNPYHLPPSKHRTPWLLLPVGQSWPLSHQLFSIPILTKCLGVGLSAAMWPCSLGHVSQVLSFLHFP